MISVRSTSANSGTDWRPSERVRADLGRRLVIIDRNQGGGVVNEVLIFDGGLMREGHRSCL